MTTLYDEILQGHQALQQEEQAESTPDRVERVQAFIAEVVAAGEAIADTRQREQLRSILRYWSAWVYDRTKEYPQSQLRPPSPSAVAAEEGRARAAAWMRRHPGLAGALGIGAVVVLILLIVILAAAVLGMSLGALAPRQGGSQGSQPTSTPPLAVLATDTLVLPTAAVPPSATATRPSPVPAIATVTLTPAPTSTPEPTSTPTLTDTPAPTPTFTPGPSPTPTNTQPPHLVARLQPKGGIVFGVAFSPAGDLLAAAEGDGRIGLWKMATGNAPAQAATLKFGAAPLAVEFSPYGDYLAGAFSDNVARIWHLAQTPGQDLQVTSPITFAGHTQSVTSATFSGDGTLVATGSVDGLVKVWELSSRSELARLYFGTPVINVLFDPATPAGDRLFGAGYSSQIEIWNSQQGKIVGNLFGKAAKAGRNLAFSVDGLYLAVGDYDGAVRLWHRPAADSLAFVPLSKPVEAKGAGYAVAFSSGGLLATGKDDGTINLWQVGSAGVTLVATLTGQHEGPVRALAFSPNGDWLASGGSDQNVVVWAVR